MFSFVDRRGGIHALDARVGEPLVLALLRNSVPPTSVVTYLAGTETILPDHYVLRENERYEARLIEGYDIQTLRELSTVGALGTAEPGQYLHRRLAMAHDGGLAMESVPLTLAQVAAHVQETVTETLDTFKLMQSGDRLLLGLSGGVDSGSLLMLLAEHRLRSSHGFTIEAATFKDFDSRWSETFEAARRLAEHHDVEHSVIEPEFAQEVFHLSRPLAQALMLLMETEDAHLTMYADHHTTRRVLECHGDARGTQKVALGLHATDLLAGLISSYATGYPVSPAPHRHVGPYEYVLPLAFVPKRELHLYYQMRVGSPAKQTTPNQWEFNPTDRNFFYYFADYAQWFWPGIDKWLLTGHARSARQLEFKTCENCGASVADVVAAGEWSGTCDVCAVFHRHGWLQA